MCSEVSQPSGSAGSGPFQCLLRFSRVGSARASAVSTQQKPMGPTLQLSLFHLVLWLLGLPEPETLFAHLRRPCAWIPSYCTAAGILLVLKDVWPFLRLMMVFLGTWLTAFWEYIEFAQRHVRHCFTIKFKFRFSPLQGQVSLYKWQLDEQKPFVCKGLCSRAVMPAASMVCSTQMRASYPASSASRVPGLFWARRAAPPPRFACPAVRHALATHCWPFLSFSSRLLLTCSFSRWDPFCWGLQLVAEFREPQMSISVSKPCIGFLLIPSWVADVWNLTQPVYPQLKLLDPECPIFLPLPSSPHTLLR